MLIKVLITLGKIVASVSFDIVIKVAEIQVFHINLPRFDNLAAWDLPTRRKNLLILGNLAAELRLWIMNFEFKVCGSLPEEC